MSESGGSIALGTPARMPEFSLQDKVILVSGAARGLGLVQAEALLEAGATVHALDRLPEPSPAFHEVAKRAKELGTSLHYHRIDVRDVPNLNKIVEAIGNEHGRLDGLIAAAGIQQEIPAIEYPAEEIDNILHINVTGVFMTAQAAARQMIKYGRGGSICLIGSMSGTIANRGLICPAYNSSKAAVLQLARNLASEWGNLPPSPANTARPSASPTHQSIRVNSLSPGYILTDMVDALFEQYPERRRDWPQENMLGRLSKPAEYRGAAVFLMSDASSFLTGADLRMDGGHSSW
ncbi:NAD(P)-binding protein [Viridothelium virens]|uniref:NAD(P)-binding protein n=1 Tax=Viridothelium virens TaxID=1048519 RepID=A0A6A6GVJ5_VIRVR|nr:NAD(P)-binding protein [Viridothelium virens]